MYFIASGPYGSLISPIVVELSAQTAERLHVKIYDPNNKRWEVPDRWDECCLHANYMHIFSFSSIPDDPSSTPSSRLYSWYYPAPEVPFFLSMIRYQWLYTKVS